ncbi:MAG: SPOR domain-containing protein [Deltaproteobacteria bacterium]|nr:SPOR domain-containing protein [Deltaproteobacteria bacterium]
MANQRAMQELAPPARRMVKAPPQQDKLVNTEEAQEGDAPQAEGDEAAQDIPTYQVGADGSLRPAPEQEAQGRPEPENIAVNKSLIATNIDKNTMVRFKSSGNSKFSVQVAEFFDELLASREITKLKSKGYEAYLVIDQRGATPSFDVRVGSFGDRHMAEQFATKMSNEQNVELRVVQAD